MTFGHYKKTLTLNYIIDIIHTKCLNLLTKKDISDMDDAKRKMILGWIERVGRSELSVVDFFKKNKVPLDFFKKNKVPLETRVKARAKNRDQNEAI
jgi:hypothetical protein